MHCAREEFSETAKRVFAPGCAQGGNVKAAIAKCSKVLGISWDRARDLLRKRREPRVHEMDTLRELDGRWCNRLKRAKERVEDKIDAIYEFVETLKAKRKAKREARLSKSSFVERTSVS